MKNTLERKMACNVLVDIRKDLVGSATRTFRNYVNLPPRDMALMSRVTKAYSEYLGNRYNK
jgi:hypothetical protein